jgi:hypothetical protein
MVATAAHLVAQVAAQVSHLLAFIPTGFLPPIN